MDRQHLVEGEDGIARPARRQDGGVVELHLLLQRPARRPDGAAFDLIGDIVRCQRNERLADLEAVAEWTAINGVVQACRDPDDDKSLETALVAQADCIVTGDGDLLALDPFEHIRVVTAARFLEAVSG